METEFIILLPLFSSFRMEMNLRWKTRTTWKHKHTFLVYMGCFCLSYATLKVSCDVEIVKLSELRKTWVTSVVTFSPSSVSLFMNHVKFVAFFFIWPMHRLIQWHLTTSLKPMFIYYLRLVFRCRWNGTSR